MHELYRFFDKDDALIYVGISFNAFLRFNQHRYSAPFFDDITKVTIERFESTEAAAEAESNAIKNEAPKYNKTWRVQPKPKKPEPYQNVSARDLAAIFNCHIHTIYAMARDGRIPVRRLPGFKCKWDKGEIDAWLNSGRKRNRANA